MQSQYKVLSHLDDPEIYGLWTVDEFIAMVVPFFIGIISQHIGLGILCAVGFWYTLKKLKAGNAISWMNHAAYWYFPPEFVGLKATPPSFLSLMVG